MDEYRIPFSRPTNAPHANEYVAAALKSGLLSGDGPFSRRCEALIGDQLGGARAMLTPSCTAALEMAALLLEIEPGDEVIVPTYTFTSTAAAFALRGARVVFADCRADTMNIDERKVEGLFTHRTRAIVVVHYGGIACEMDAIEKQAADHGVPVVEDNAHGLGALYHGRKLGTIGALGTQSFHATKNIGCGEGGALIINDPHFVERAEILREKGTDRSRFWRGEVDKYTWVDHGSSYLLSEVAAAVLCAQLEAFDDIQARRQRIWEHYAARLQLWAEHSGVGLPSVPPGCEQAYHLFYLLLPTSAERVRLQRRLLDQGILAVTHYVPLHSSPQGRRVGEGSCPVADDISERLLRLPFYTDLTEADVDLVADVIVSR